LDGFAALEKAEMNTKFQLFIGLFDLVLAILAIVSAAAALAAAL